MDEKTAINVMVVDDHSMMRTGLRYTLQSFDDLQIVAEAEDGIEAVEKCSQSDPDVILMDMLMPGMDGAEATREIKQRCPNVEIIVLTSFEEKDLVERALKAGAIGYLLKNVTADDLAQAIRAAYAGKPTLAQEATEVLVSSTQENDRLGSDLTLRELEVLELMAAGLTNLQIAGDLVISQSTVKFHVRNILSKMGASNRTEAINLAWQHNLISQQT